MNSHTDKKSLEELLALHEQDATNRYPLVELAKLYERNGDAPNMYDCILKLKRLGPLTGIEQICIVTSLNSLPELPKYEEFETDLNDFLDYSNVNPTGLMPVLSNHFCAKYGLAEENPNIELEDLLADQLLHKAARTVHFASRHIEELFTKVRQAMVTEIASNQTISTQITPLLETIALQNHINEYVHPLSSDEEEILQLCSQLLTSQANEESWSPKDSELILLCLAMYGQLYDLPIREKLLSHPIKTWPTSLQAVAKRTLFDIAHEVEVAQQIPKLTEIDDETSLAVRTQYENNPYPRWLRPNCPPPQTYGKQLALSLPGFEPPESLLKSKFNVLLAGCGTGQQPIEMALTFPQAKITAIDISRRSLAYAQLKTEEFDVSNINFYHGDILKLGQLNERFDLIICSGVLHHMADPLQGWRILRGLLATDGILRIDLYSKIARREIIAQREIIKASNIDPTPENIKQYRQNLIADGSHENILGFGDFWTLSMCRDLLFHFQEHQFTWPEIQQCCDRLDMEFIGVGTDQQTYQQYRKRFPNDAACRDLNNWHQLELENPDLFRAMYGVWCRLRPK